MKKYILIFLLFILPLYAQTIKAAYDVTFGIVGEIGKAEITYTRDKENYTINVHAWTTSMAAVLTQNREEDYISQGRIVNGILRPDVFVKQRKNDRSSKFEVFLFEYDKNQVSLLISQEKNVNRNRFDVNTMKNVHIETKEFSQSEEIYRFFTDNDLLSLFFNIQQILPSLKDGDYREYSAIGSTGPTGAIDIEVPNEKLRNELCSTMGDAHAKLLTIIINQDIFQSTRGELHVSFDDDYFAKDVLLKDVILFGDIRGKRISQSNSSSENIISLEHN